MALDPTTILIVIVVLVIAAILNRRMSKVEKSLMWILQHVHVVSKANAKDPELKQIKQTFGIEEDDA